MFSQLRLAAFDMDGTLLNEDARMTEATREACRLLQASGCKLVLSTGRTYPSARLPIDGFPFDGYVCSNGAAVYEADGRLVQRTFLPADMVREVVDTLRQELLYYELHDTAGNRWMVQEDRERIETLIGEDASVEGLELRRHAFYEWARVAPLEEMMRLVSTGEAEIVKLFIWHPVPEQLEPVRQRLEQWGESAAITTSGPYNIEVIPKHASKWEGLLYFIRKWGFTPEQVMAFGDADNDREALTHAGYSVAMENADPAIKKIARFIAPHHNEDGVARFIRERVLGRG
ncbi:Cof subfamily protein (haloacid dehalogenase superfamily) [Brevibacillus aydinogluensis]|uniref:Hydrolase n=1 Tax=Brevibacillus aydinogluensis TaxID=927786 RepID=A0AA48MFH4_9BACL|nr:MULTISPECIES: HAD family hydrolase [Brevibacillus]MDT3416806.1 Cof subfamily protein (haloacid dehalogenase superfamily) [Brevibacillus aydinogluensis]CAJ1004580.1 Hydrolase [Brevibacillus aydinogluensis]